LPNFLSFVYVLFVKYGLAYEPAHNLTEKAHQKPHQNQIRLIVLPLAKAALLSKFLDLYDI
jgi:hypothetical protein